MDARNRQAGFTLIELLIAVAVMAIVTAQLFMVFSSQKRTFSANQRALDVQEDARLVLDLIAFDARMAGFMVPRIVGVASEDGGANAADRLCVSDPSYFPYPDTAAVVTQLDSRSEHYTTTNVTDLNASEITVATLDLDGSQAFDGTGSVDFVASAGVIVSNGGKSFCAGIIPTGVDQANLKLTIDRSPDWAAIGIDATSGNVRAAPAIIYEVDPDTNEIRRNGVTLASSVEDLQVEYWVDNRTRNGQIDGNPTGDACTEFPVHDLNAALGGCTWTMDTSRIRRIRVSVLTRTDMREVNPDGSERITGYSGRPALANRAAAAVVDSFQRRRFVASIMPKNLL
jgi:prepilin-type N-terminal cleavage/methylation domain-containing protein